MVRPRELMDAPPKAVVLAGSRWSFLPGPASLEGDHRVVP